MIVECPCRALKAAALCLADVMEQCTPSQPQVVAATAYIVEHFKGMIEIVLMRNAVLGLDDVECCQFGHDELEKSATM